MTTITQSQFFGDAVAVRDERWGKIAETVRAEVEAEGADAIPRKSTLNEVVEVRTIARRATELGLWETLGCTKPAADCEKLWANWYIHADVPAPGTLGRRLRETRQKAEERAELEKRVKAAKR